MIYFLAFTALKIVCVLVPVLTIVAYAVLAERKISAFIQDRLGPNRAAPPLVAKIPVLGRFLTRLGLFQPLADFLKFLLKEDFTPAYVRKA